ncbi:MAG: hypothetical protein ACUVV4_04920 [Candidatus Bathyarchaeia archaeon]
MRFRREAEGRRIHLQVRVKHCEVGGHNRLKEFAKGLPGVVYSEENQFTCSEVGMQSIQEKVKETTLTGLL